MTGVSAVVAMPRSFRSWKLDPKVVVSRQWSRRPFCTRTTLTTTTTNARKTPHSLVGCGFPGTTRTSHLQASCCSFSSSSFRWNSSGGSSSAKETKKEKKDDILEYQYPLAEEHPTIFKSLASTMTEEDHAQSTTLPKEPEEQGEEMPPVDKTEEEVKVLDRLDRSKLSSWEIEQIRSQQRAMLPKTLSASVTSMNQVPSTLLTRVVTPPPKSPETHISELDNGIRIISEDAEFTGPASTVGIVSKVGSRREIHPTQRGVTNVLELLSFGTPTRSCPDPAAYLALEMGGAAHLCAMGREQSIHFIDLLRPHANQAFALLQEIMLDPQWNEEHVAGAKQALGFQAEDAPLEIILGEALQQAAYGSDQSLGQPHLFLEDNPELTAQVLHDFWHTHFIQNPKDIVISGVGIDHDQLRRLAQDYFGHLTQVPSTTDDAKNALDHTKDSALQPPFRPSVYRGGQVCAEREADNGFVRMGLGLPVDGWHSDDVAAIVVLQTLLGGGSSFSAGGPGKGMYSRVYRQVLNAYEWAESAECFATFYEEGGVFGLTGSCLPQHNRTMMALLCEQVLQIAKKEVDPVELERARNMLRGLVLTQLESRLVLCEDLGRQLSTYNRREEIPETLDKIHAVTAQDLQRIAQQAVEAIRAEDTLATTAAVGPDLETVPSGQEITSWFRNA